MSIKTEGRGKQELSPESKKFTIAGITFIIVVILNPLAAFIASDMKQVVTSDITGHMTTDSLFDLSLNASNGHYVQYELTVNNNQTVNVYLMGEDQFYLMRSSQSFDYISASFGVNHVKTDSLLSGNQTYFVLVSNTSYDPENGVPVSWTVQQSHYPLVYHDVFNILALPLLALTFLTFFCLIKYYQGFAADRRARKAK